jgi:large subunit ribosomal protein L10
MRLEEKKQAVSELTEKLERSSIVITTSYRGITVAEMTELRRRLRQQEIEYRVIKNTLAGFAAAKAGKEQLSGIIEGPTALAFGYGDIVVPARALTDYIRSTKSELRINGGLVDQRVLSAAEVANLATLPPKEVLIARLLIGMRGSILGLVNVLNANLTGLINVLAARRNQLEGG